MGYLVEIRGNYIVFTDESSGLEIEGFTKDVKITRLNSTSDTFNIHHTNPDIIRGVLFSDLKDAANGNTPFTLSGWIDFYSTKTGNFSSTSGGSGVGFKYTATNYTDLTTVVAPSATEGDLAIVSNSQGVWLINRKLKGVYIYQSGNWEYANQELQNYLQTAVQPGDNISVLNNDAGYITNGMDAATYDPNNVQDDAFDYANFLGTFQIGGSTTTVNMSSDKDNLDLDGFNIVNFTTGSQDRRITGIKAPAAGENRVICFFNDSSQYRIRFIHQSGSSTASNRIVLRGQAPSRNLLQYQTAFAIYNHNLNRWHITRIG